MTNSWLELGITEPTPDFSTSHTLKNKTVDCTLSKELKRMEVHEQGEALMIKVAVPGLLPGQSRQLQEQKKSTGKNMTQGIGPVCPQPWWVRCSAASLPTGWNNHFQREGKGYPCTHTIVTPVTAGKESPSRQGNNFLLTAEKFCNSWNTFTHFLGQLCCLLWYKHSPAILFQRAFCNTSSAASLVEPSKHLPAVLFLYKAQKHLHTLLRFNCFCNSHRFNEKGILPDNLIYFEDHLWKLSHKPLSPFSRLPFTQCMSTLLGWAVKQPWVCELWPPPK